MTFLHRRLTRISAPHNLRSKGFVARRLVACLSRPRVRGWVMRRCAVSTMKR
jgi:hypothetical protein